jgi:hypothetical protein
MRAIAAVWLALAVAARADEKVTIEKATIPWSELERLLRKEGAAPPPRLAPRAYAIPTLEVSGDVDEGRVELRLTVEVQVLADRWTLAPLLPPSLAVAHATVSGPDGKRGLLVRDGAGVAFVGEGAGRFVVELAAEGALDGGRRLLIAPPGLAGGRARLDLHGADSVGGRTAWRTRGGPAGALTVEAALGASGLELVLPKSEAAREPGTALDDLEAITVVSLGGAGVTRLGFGASGDEHGELQVTLPAGARLWKAYVGGTPLPLNAVQRHNSVQLPLQKPARVELAYTFEATPLGLRGRYHVELPRLPVPVRSARWELWLPDGLRYGAPQATLAPSSCGQGRARAKTPIVPVGTCLGFQRTVLPPGGAYIEGSYEQPL